MAPAKKSEVPAVETEAVETAVVEVAESVEEGVVALAEEGRAFGSDVSSRIEGLNNPGTLTFSTISNESFEDRIKVASAMSNSTPVETVINEVITLKDFIIQKVEILDTVKGEIVDVPRVIIVTDTGEAYHATSIGLLSSVESLLAVVGHPSTWEGEIKVKVVRERTRRGFNVFTLRYV